MVIAERKAWYTNVQQQPVFWLTERELKKKRGTTTLSNLKSEFYASSTILSSYVWEMKKRKNVTPALILGSLTNCESIFIVILIGKSCSLSLHEKLAIITYPYPDERLNRRSELVTKCRHQNNNWSFEPYDNLRKYKIKVIPNGFILLEFSAWVIRQEQNKDIFRIIWRCLCFAFVESFRCCMSARWNYSEYRL